MRFWKKPTLVLVEPWPGTSIELRTLTQHTTWVARIDGKCVGRGWGSAQQAEYKALECIHERIAIQEREQTLKVLGR